VAAGAAETEEATKATRVEMAIVARIFVEMLLRDDGFFFLKWDGRCPIYIKSKLILVKLYTTNCTQNYKNSYSLLWWNSTHEELN
jgi:hypothetical protein